MSAYTRTLTLLRCDECGREANFGAEDVTEARIAASHAGWKYRKYSVSRQGQRGGVTARVRDACEGCELPATVEP